MNRSMCPDCDEELQIPVSVIHGEILSCPSCGLELEVQKTGDYVDLLELAIKGEDWGE